MEMEPGSRSGGRAAASPPSSVRWSDADGEQRACRTPFGAWPCAKSDGLLGVQDRQDNLQDLVSLAPEIPNVLGISFLLRICDLPLLAVLLKHSLLKERFQSVTGNDMRCTRKGNTCLELYLRLSNTGNCICEQCMFTSEDPGASSYKYSGPLESYKYA